MDYYLFNGRAIFQQERVAYGLQENRRRGLRMASGETFATSSTGRVKRNAGLARGTRPISEQLCCGLEAGPDLQKIG
jgi:hypothetical protein